MRWFVGKLFFLLIFMISSICHVTCAYHNLKPFDIPRHFPTFLLLPFCCLQRTQLSMSNGEMNGWFWALIQMEWMHNPWLYGTSIAQKLNELDEFPDLDLNDLHQKVNPTIHHGSSIPWKDVLGGSIKLSRPCRHVRFLPCHFFGGKDATLLGYINLRTHIYLYIYIYILYIYIYIFVYIYIYASIVYIKACKFLDQRTVRSSKSMAAICSHVSHGRSTGQLFFSILDG